MKVQETDLFKLLNNGTKSFNAKCKWMINLANLIHISDTEIKSGEEFPLIDGNQVMLASIFFQNVMHPKNSHRREAVASNQYVDFKSEDDAAQYFNKLLSTNLQFEFAGRETAIRSELQSAQSYMSANLFIEAPDIYYAAAVMVQLKLYIGKGDIRNILRMLVKTQNAVATKDKLMLLQMGTFFSVRLISDHFNVYPDRFRIGRQTQYRLWLNLVRKRGLLTNEEFKEVFPNASVAADLWDRVMDEDGNATLDKKCLGEYLYKRSQEKKLQKAKVQGKKNKKLNF